MLELKIGCLSVFSEMPNVVYSGCLKSLDILEYLVKSAVVLLFHMVPRKCYLFSKHSIPVDFELLGSSNFY